jgi:hypothetical protein
MNRTHERVTYLIETVLEAASGRREARISDLSPGGCYVDSIMAMSSDEKVVFTIPMPDGARLRINGRVAYTLPGCGFGVNFTDLTEDDSQAINRLIEAQTC